MSTEQQFTADQDPADFTVDQVTAYLATASTEDAQRVKDAEAAGKNRVGIVGYVPSPDDVPADEDGYKRVPVEDAYRPGEPISRD